MIRVILDYFIDVGLSYPCNIGETSRNFPFAPEKKIINPDDFTPYMKKIKPMNYTETENLKCDRTNKKKCLIHYWMLNFYVRHGLVVDKAQEIISLKQSKWIENFKKFNTMKNGEAKYDFEKGFYKLLHISFYGKTVENLGNRGKLEFIKKDDNEKITKQQSKLTFNAIHISYTIYDSYSLKQIEVLMDEPIYLGFAIIELS